MAEAARNTTLNEDERDALYGYLCRQERDAMAAKDAAEAKRKENFKKAKEWGFSRDEIEIFDKVRRNPESTKIVDKHRITERVLIKIGKIPDARKGDLFADRADKLQLLYAEGYAHGLVGEGGPGCSKFAVNSDEDNAYLDGWKDGQMKYAQNWQAAMEKAIAANSKEEPPVSPDGDDPFADAGDTAH